VPLIVYAPGLVPDIENKVVQGIDIAPTILKMLEIEIPESFEGGSLFGESKPAVSERDTKAEPIPFSVQTFWWKYYAEPNKEMLFNLVNDSDERKNVVERYPLIKADYIKVYDAFLNTSNTTNVTNASISNETLERLRSLGYVG
jgi:arylsulfatase A-like enzyme